MSFERAPDGLALQLTPSTLISWRERDVFEFLADLRVEASTTHAILRPRREAVKLGRGQAAEIAGCQGTRYLGR